MTVAEIVTLARQLLNDPSPNGRWSDATLINFADRASKKIMRDVLFPAVRLLASTIGGIQEYQLPTGVLQVNSVYVNGQLAVPTDIPTLEGHQIQQYDQNLYGPSYAQTQPGSGGPPGANGPFAPKWVVQPNAAYPVQNSWSGSAPNAQPWGWNQRPRYYWRGGWIGLVPAPSNSGQNGVANLCVDGVMLPDTLTTLVQVTWFPEHFVEALAWKVVEFAKYSDDTATTAQSRLYAAQQYAGCMRDMRMWVSTYQGDAAGGPKVQSNRSNYRMAGHKVNRSGTGYP